MSSDLFDYSKSRMFGVEYNYMYLKIALTVKTLYIDIGQQIYKKSNRNGRNNERIDCISHPYLQLRNYFPS